jgi:hypothetical protein
MGLPGKSIPIIVEPLELPAPAREVEREKRPVDPEPAPAEPHVPDEEPAPT